jgi:hypothetical protein
VWNKSYINGNIASKVDNPRQNSRISKMEDRIDMWISPVAAILENWKHFVTFYRLVGTFS